MFSYGLYVFHSSCPISVRSIWAATERAISLIRSFGALNKTFVVIDGKDTWYKGTILGPSTPNDMPHMDEELRMMGLS